MPQRWRVPLLRLLLLILKFVRYEKGHQDIQCGGTLMTPVIVAGVGSQAGLEDCNVGRECQLRGRV